MPAKKKPSPGLTGADLEMAKALAEEATAQKTGQQASADVRAAATRFNNRGVVDTKSWGEIENARAAAARRTQAGWDEMDASDNRANIEDAIIAAEMAKMDAEMKARRKKRSQ